MTGKKQGALRGVALAALMLATACAGEAATSPAKYGAEQCHRVAVIDQASGLPIRGAEDLVLDAANDRLFISAYDRRAVEKAARKKAFSIPEGGLYTVSFSRLTDDKATTVNAGPIVRADDIAGGLRPHGLAFDAAVGEITFINRAYQRIDDKWRMTPRVERVGANGEVFMGGVDEAPCAANDVLEDRGKTYLSFDHEACGWRASLEDALSLRRSGVAAGSGETLFSEAAFANGIARTLSGDIALADTRANSILLMSEDGASLKLRNEIATPGGPDNLTIAEDGGVVAAVHPSLIRIGLHRRLGFGSAPSRIVKADPDKGSVEILFDDPNGELFSAASVAVEWRGSLIVGSVTDEGLLVCKGTG
ncbi:MAG: hypothetical protein WD076_05350 [Parvularculaceae bacterium]